MGEFSKDVDILGSSCRMYILLVMTKAGSFFDKNTPQYEKYKHLLKSKFEIEIEEETFQVNSFVKNNGQEIVHKIGVTGLKVLEHAERYGIQPALGEWQ